MAQATPSNAGGDQTLLFCIGAQKAGTTWLQSQLTALDRTFFAEPKELHYRDCIRSPYLEKYRYRAKARLHVPTDTASLRYRLSALWRSDLKRRINLADRYNAIYRAGPYDHTAYLSYVGLGKTGATA
ncbi:hypothetical protein [Jannaschia sp. 2305UL9-9]|uniref:hypothetical protein n=1 Tax=Jannaschia sp. 2305UL9-9 TaxID=3121638 RepID=UPI0035280BF3